MDVGSRRRAFYAQRRKKKRKKNGLSASPQRDAPLRFSSLNIKDKESGNVTPEVRRFDQIYCSCATLGAALLTGCAISRKADKFYPERRCEGSFTRNLPQAFIYIYMGGFAPDAAEILMHRSVLSYKNKKKKKYPSMLWMRCCWSYHLLCFI